MLGEGIIPKLHFLLLFIQFRFNSNAIAIPISVPVHSSLDQAFGSPTIRESNSCTWIEAESVEAAGTKLLIY
jgi:hypothetical protein